jgi:hypothetical protein
MSVSYEETATSAPLPTTVPDRLSGELRIESSPATPNPFFRVTRLLFIFRSLRDGAIRHAASCHDLSSGRTIQNIVIIKSFPFSNNSLSPKTTEEEVKPSKKMLELPYRQSIVR